MGIEGLGPINNYNKFNKKVNNSKKVNENQPTDSVNISKDAINSLETSKINDILNNTPDVRADKVAEIKAKLNNPNYLNEVIAKDLADKILESMGL